MNTTDVLWRFEHKFSCDGPFRFDDEWAEDLDPCDGLHYDERMSLPSKTDEGEDVLENDPSARFGYLTLGSIRKIFKDRKPLHLNGFVLRKYEAITYHVSGDDDQAISKVIRLLKTFEL